MLQVQFKCKPQKHVRTLDSGTVTTHVVVIPKLTRAHCLKLDAWRSSRRFGSYANSDLFPAILARAVREIAGERFDMTKTLPAGVTLKDGFLTTVTIDIPDSK